MGLFNWLARMTSTPTQQFSESAPKPIDRMFAELRGAGSNPRVGREEALSVPTVQRGRNLLCSIATLPLEQLDPKNNVARNPLLEQIDPDVPNVVTLAQTVEDLVFEAIAWWEVTAFGFDGFPVSARRLDPCTVSLDPPAGRRSPSPLPGGEDPRGAVVYVDGKEVPASKIIRFDSPNPAVLKVGGRAIKRALLLDKAARMYADDPRALEYFTQDPEAEAMGDDDVAEFLDTWMANRRKRAAAYVPPGITYNSADSPTPADLQLVQLQAQAALDIANAFGLDPEELGVSTTSRTYSNVNDRRRDKINDVLAPYMRAITDRLSMGDVTKRGYRIRFNLDDYLKANAAERWANYEKAKNMGVLDEAEIRQLEGLPPRTAPAPADGAQASEDAEHHFDSDGGLQFADIPVEQFSVDAEKRVIEGLALPYGQVGVKHGMAFRFQKGALKWSDVSRVKLLRDHDPKQPIGVAVELNDTPRGLKVKFKVARGAAGDDALAMAEDGVLDGLSVGVDFNFSTDTTPDPQNRDGVLVRRGDLREVSLTPMPAFDNARVTKVAASLTEGTRMTESANGQSPEAGTATNTPTEAPAVTLSADQFAELLKFAGQNVPAPRQSPENAPADEGDQRQVINPTRLTASTSVSEALPYRFDRGGRFVRSDHEFTADIRDMLRAGDEYGQYTDAGKRAMGLIQARFAVVGTDVNELNPTINRPDMYVDQRDYKYPLWNAINKGTPPNGVQPFGFPKFNTSSGLVGDHTEGTEPTSGAFTTTGQTVTPTAVSGKASITREVWEQGGNPAVSTLIFNQMVRGYNEALESAAATFLNTLTAATDINLGVAVVDDALADAWDQAVAGLQFVRGYDFSVFAIEQVLYKAFVAAEDSAGRPLYPILNPQNANGTSAPRFQQLNLSGVVGTPSWALASTPGAANNSWLFDPSTVHGWATAPQRLEFAGTDASGGYAPVAMVDIACFGYKALANSDIGGVRQVIYDSVT